MVINYKVQCINSKKKQVEAMPDKVSKDKLQSC